MIELYHCLLHRLEKGDPDEKTVKARVEFLRRDVGELLAQEIKPEELDDHFKQLNFRYLLTVTPEEMSNHIRLEKQLEKEGLSWQVKGKHGNWELTVMSRRHLGLLARVAGILTLHKLDIRKAQTHTKKTGVALQIFEVAAMEPDAEVGWEQVISDLQKTLQGRLALEYRLAMQASRQKRKPSSVPKKPDEVVVDNDSSDRYTIIEVYTTDRLGLLYAITRTLLELDLQVFVAKISTRMDQVADIFYVRTQDGEKAEDPEHVGEIKQALLYGLQQ
jgi:[protein-PII] uridylyltransferase